MKFKVKCICDYCIDSNSNIMFHNGKEYDLVIKNSEKIVVINDLPVT